MHVVRTVKEMREVVRAHRRTGARIALVPTMGALHEGHLSLVRRARELADAVVVSVFVNPTQFNDPSDLAAYPRREADDVALAADAGATVVFAPPVEEVYPAGFATRVQVRGPLTETLEGAHRGVGHFDGVTTVVTKLFGMVTPDVALFGQKDAQQVAVVRTLVRDLDIPVEIEVCPTVRDPDGLALSSRNARLHGDDRRRALALITALRAVEECIAGGATVASELVAKGEAAMAGFGVVPEYLAIVEPTGLGPVEVVDGPVLVLVAARVGDVRLIDNLLVSPPGGAR